MAWIIATETNDAINLDYVVRIKASNDDVFKFEFLSERHGKEWIVFAVMSNDDHIFLSAFDTQEESKKLMIGLARWQETGQPPEDFFEKK